MRVRPGGLFACLLAASGASCALAATDRIPAAIATDRLATLRARPRPEATLQNDQGPVDPARPIEYATLYLTPAPGLESFLAELQNPSSPNFHRWLSPEEFADRFGLTGNDTSQLTAWLRSQGLIVHDIARGRHWITFSGTAARVGRAFHTELRRYHVNGADHFANATALSVPAAFAAVISAVGGLDDFGPVPQHQPPAPLPQPLLNSGSSHYLAPDDIAVIYNLTPLYAAGLDGTGQKLAVIGQTDINLADLRSFRTRFGLPPNDPQVILYGPSPGIRSNDLAEADLDLEWAGAVARNATLLYVNSRSVFTSAQYAIDQNLASVMTLSYGGCEAATSDLFRAIAQQGSAQGITWMISSGDSGAATCDLSSLNGQATKGLTVAYPASIPEVTAVGGTEFDDAAGNWWAPANSPTRASALSYIPEKVWTEGGGGASLFFPKPFWQTGPGVPADGRRDVPDVSFSASTHVGYQVVSAGGIYVLGGTSASSPVFAGIVALLNQAQAAANPVAPPGLGNINPALYRLAAATTDVFHDITTGDNKVACAQSSPGCVDGILGYAATAGYDLASGLGSLDAARLVASWNAGTPSTTTLLATPAAYSPGDAVKLTATVTGAGAVPSGAVTFLANDAELGAVELTRAARTASASLTVEGILLAGGNGTVSALYSGDTNFAASASIAPLTLKLPATGSFVIPSVSPNPVRQSGASWPYTLQLAEKAGVPTKITVFTINNANNLGNITSPNLAAKGVFTASLSGSNITPPLDRVFHLEGVDADGTLWERDLTVPFIGLLANRLAPSISLSASPAVVQQNPQSDPACQWSAQVTVQEKTGFAVSLTSFVAGGVSLTGKLSQLFGATRLAPLGMLNATVCFSGVAPPVQRTLTLAGIAETGSTVSASATVTLAGPPASAAQFSVSTPALAITDTASLDLRLTAPTPAWTVTLLPSAQKWLAVDKTTGAGPATLHFTASATGLSPGVYNALVSVQTDDALPQVLRIPVVFTTGVSSATQITGIGNAASGAPVFAPGQLIAVYGKQLAPVTRSATTQPLPLTLSGVSATVNGVSAPLWFISDSQINLQIPYETSAGPAVLGIHNNGQITAFPFTVTPTAPGIFAFEGAPVPYASGSPGQTLVCFLTGEGDVTPTLVSGATPPTGTVLSQFPQPRQPLTMTIGGEPAKIVFNGIVTGLIGVTQVNFTIPADLPPGPQPVVVTVGGVSSAPVTLRLVPK